MVEGVVVVPDEHLEFGEERAHHGVRTGAVARRQRDEVLGFDEAHAGRVERDGLRGVTVLGEVREELRVEGTVLDVPLGRIGRVAGVRRRLAGRLEVRRATTIAAGTGGVGEPDLLAPGRSSERVGGRLLGEPAGALAEALAALVDGVIVDVAGAGEVVGADVRLPDERHRRYRPPLLRQVRVDRPEVGLELAELLLDARQHEHALEPGVRVPDEVDPRGQREHGLAGPAGALQREKAVLARGLDRGLDAVDLLVVRLGVAEDGAPGGVGGHIPRSRRFA